MQRLKPTAIFALDPAAAAFCQAVHVRLERTYGARGTLLQFHGIVRELDGIRFEADLTQVARTGWQDLSGGASGGETSYETDAFWERAVATLEGPLVKMLRIGRSFEEIQAAQRNGIEIADERVIYFVLSTFESSNGPAIMHLARMLQWLLARRLAGEVCSVHALLLLPDLLDAPADTHMAATYGVLKRFDDLVLHGVDPGTGPTRPPFDTCWVMDGLNARAVTLGSLHRNLEGYADAFAGLLSAEPERSGAIPGGRSRGKVPAYNAFGFGELYLPSDVAMTRLSSALGRDIVRTAFLGDGVAHEGTRRSALLAAKGIVLGKGYADQLNDVDREAGALIWRDFHPRAEFSGDPHAFIYDLRREHEEFQRKDLLGMRESLDKARARVTAGILSLIDAELDRQIDAHPTGFRNAVDLLEALRDPDVALDRDTLGDEPQNLATEFVAAGGSVDRQLNVSVDRPTTRGLLLEVQDVGAQLRRIDRDLRMLAGGDAGATATNPSSEESLPREDEDGTPDVSRPADSPAERDIRASLLEEREVARTRLSELSERYRHAASDEERAAATARQAAQRAAFQQRATAIGGAEDHLVEASEALRMARRAVEDLEVERQQFRSRVAYLLSVLMLVFIVPILIAVLGLRGTQAYAGWIASIVLAVIVVFSCALLGLLHLLQLHPRLVEARRVRGAREQEQRAAVSQLERSRNEALELEYDLDAVERRKEMFAAVIGGVQRRTEDIRTKLRSLVGLADTFHDRWASSTPDASTTRRPLLTAGDIDAYYTRVVPSVPADAGAFLKDVKRSAVRLMPLDAFDTRLTAFARTRFDALAQLTVEDVLLQRGQPVLVPTEAALQRLQELNDAAAPLVYLHTTDLDTAAFAQQHATLWVGEEDHDAILKLYRRIKPDVTARWRAHGRSIRVLTRSLHFPAYFLAAIEHYRSCYERVEARDAAELPDLVPADPEMKKAQEHLLLGLALGAVTRTADGAYVLPNGTGVALGSTRKQAVENLSGVYAYRRQATELAREIKERTRDGAAVRTRLLDLLATPGDLDGGEQQVLESLAQKYHPLR